MPFRWFNPPSTDGEAHSMTDRAAQFSALVEVIRTEIRVGVDPLRGDIATLKTAVDEVRQQQRQMYSREVMDLKLSEVHEVIGRLRSDHEELVLAHHETSARIGGLWRNVFLTAGIVLGPLSALAALLAIVPGLFHIP